MRSTTGGTRKKAAITQAEQGKGLTTHHGSKQQQKGCDFLMAKQKDGVFSVQTRRGSFPDPGFTSLAIAAIQSKPKDKRSEAEQAAIDDGLRFGVHDARLLAP